MKAIKYILLFFTGVLVGGIIISRCYDVHDVLQGIENIADTRNALFWNLLILPVLAVGLAEIELELRGAYFKVYRCRSLIKWWVPGMGRAYLSTLLCYGGLTVCILVSGHKEASCLLLITVHAASLLAAGTLIRLLTGRMITAAVSLILAENFGIILSKLSVIPYKFNMTVWGMERFSEPYKRGGFSPLFGIVCQLIFIMIICFGTPVFGRGLILRRLDNEKNDRA